MFHVMCELEHEASQQIRPASHNTSDVPHFEHQRALAPTKVLMESVPDMVAPAVNNMGEGSTK